MNSRSGPLLVFALSLVLSGGVTAGFCQAPPVVSISQELTLGPFQPSEFEVNGHGSYPFTSPPLPAPPTHAVALKWSGSEFLLAWAEQTNGFSGESHIRAGLLDAGGHLISPGIIDLPASAGNSGKPKECGYPEIAFNGSNFLLVWVEESLLDNRITVVAERISASGVLLDTAPAVILDVPLFDLMASPYTARPVVTWNGHSFIVLSCDGTYLVSPNGEVTVTSGPFGAVNKSPSSSVVPNGNDVAWMGTQYSDTICKCPSTSHRTAVSAAAAFSDDPDLRGPICPCSTPIHAYFLIPSKSFRYTAAVATIGSPVGATSGDTYLMAFAFGSGTGGISLLVSPFSRSGEPLLQDSTGQAGTVPAAFMTDNPHANLDLASSGSEYLAVFETGGVDHIHAIAAAVIDQSGNRTTDQFGLTLSAGHDESEPVVEAVGPGRYLVAYRFRKDGYVYVGGRFVDINPRSKARAVRH